MTMPQPGLRKILLLRQGLLALPAPGSAVLQPEAAVRAFEIELAALGYVFSAQLSARLRRLGDEPLRQCRDWLLDTLAEHLGSKRRHDPLFKLFPREVPADTTELWLQRVLSHYLQHPQQPCLFCHRTGTTHVLSPCLHVVCDRCFDARLYSGCPVCGAKTAASPFYREPAPPPAPPADGTKRGPKPRKLKLIHWAEDPAAAAGGLFGRLCRRQQALSPTDREDLAVLVEELGEQVFPAIPEAIPVRENVALVFGGLLRKLPAERVLAAGRPFLKTATDVLRLIAAYSGADPSLQKTFKSEKMLTRVALAQPRWFGPIAEMLRLPQGGWVEVSVPIGQYRFKVARLPRPLRRALLGLLESLPEENLFEDLQRHRSFWVWVGEFLHPHEYAGRFPKVAEGFAILRKKGPDGEKAGRYPSFAACLEEAFLAADGRRVVDLLRSRPGELGRRFDHALRVLDPESGSRLLELFAAAAGRFSMPVLLTLLHHLPQREKPLPWRIFWPKGSQSLGVSAPDRRPPLPREAIEAASAAVLADLLRRFAERPALADLLVDRRLAEVVAPFNERTASPAAISLPRGSRIPLPEGNLLRLFLHWCQPEGDTAPTDVDLSVAFFGEAWDFRETCSYYELTVEDGKGGRIAQSSGDFTRAPFPDGASEFVDVDLEKARGAGFRWAVMVVAAYAGLPFSQLERSFAGLQLRDDGFGLLFDPQAVELKFQLTGHNGVFLPLAVDLESRTLHWLDSYSKGNLLFNNVENSKRAIGTICPRQIDYFERGSRASLYELGLLHAAARARRVFLRGDDGSVEKIERRPGEGTGLFLRRLATGRGVPADLGELAAPLLALLYRGDLELPEGAEAYALFREKTQAVLAAGDLL